MSSSSSAVPSCLTASNPRTALLSGHKERELTNEEYKKLIEDGSREEHRLQQERTESCARIAIKQEELDRLNDRETKVLNDLRNAIQEKNRDTRNLIIMIIVTLVVLGVAAYFVLKIRR